MSRDPVEENGGIAIYGALFNDPLDMVDAAGAQPTTNFGPRNTNSLPPQHPYVSIGGNPLTILRELWGVPWSILSGDIFDKKGIISESDLKFGDDKCSVTVTINGIWNDDDAARYLRDKVGQAPRFNGGALVSVQNGTHWRFGDLLQILGHELGAIDVTSDRAATQINIAYAALKKNGCPCGVIRILAHSQGSMILNRALPLIDKRAKPLLCITTIGPEKALARNPSFADIENYRNQNDWIPKLGNEWNFLRWLDIPQTVNGYDLTILNSPNPSTTEHGFEAHYKTFIRELPTQCEKKPLK